jgi:hypothetical protein
MEVAGYVRSLAGFLSRMRCTAGPGPFQTPAVGTVPVQQRTTK